MGMRLGQFTGNALTRNWVREIPTVANYIYLASRGEYVYVQGSSEGTVQKRRRVDGELIWQRDMMTEGGNSAWGYANIAVDSSYNIYTTKDRYLYKHDDNGNQVWAVQVEEAESGRNLIFSISPDMTRIMLLGTDSKKILSYRTLDGVKDVEFTPVEQHGYTLFRLYEGTYDSQNNFIIRGEWDIIPTGSVYLIMKYDNSGTLKFWQKNCMYYNYNYRIISVDKEDNIWTLTAPKTLSKLGKNTGNVLCSNISDDNFNQILSLSNGDVVTIFCDTVSDTLTMNRYNTNAVLQKTETHTGVTALHRVDVVV